MVFQHIKKKSCFIFLAIFVSIAINTESHAQNNVTTNISVSCQAVYDSAISSCLREKKEQQSKCLAPQCPGCLGSFDWPSCEKEIPKDGENCEKKAKEDLDKCTNVNSGILNVPLRNQNDSENGAEGENWCGVAALGMVLDFYGENPISTKDLAKQIGVVAGSGASNNDMLALAKSLGYEGSKIGMFNSWIGSIGYLRGQLNQGNPVIVAVKGPGYTADGHYMVVTGVSNTSVVVNDPWTGERKSFGISEFKAIWSPMKNSSLIIKK